MAPTSRRSATATADMAAARRRSTLYRLDPSATDVPLAGEPSPRSDALEQLSAPVLDQLLAQIVDTSLAVVLADGEGRVARRDAPTSATLAAMDKRRVDVGFSLAEPDVGTNGVGTSLETKRPAMVVGTDHFLEAFQMFTCANAPIFDPVTHRVEGTVGVLCPVDDTGPLLLSTALHLSARINELLLERATPAERSLLEQFLRHRRNPKTALATMGEGVLIATPAAQRLLTGVDHAELWEHVEAATRHGGETTTELSFDRPTGVPLRLRCQPVYRGGEVGGATVEFVAGRPSTRRTRRICPEDQLGDLVGASAAWRAIVRDAQQAARVDSPVLVVGDRGTGRLAIATAIADLHRSRDVRVFDSSTVLVEGAREWVLKATAAFVPDTTIVLRRIDQLPDAVAATLAAEVAATPDGARVIATTGRAAAAEPGLAALIDQLNVLRIDVPRLEDRRDDIAPLVRHLSAESGRHQVDPQVINVLYRQPWPGNVTELRQTLRSADARAATEPVGVEHLPRQIRQESSRKPLHGLRRQEADAIVAAVNSTATRTEAAELLGISRATLYRRIDAYQLDFLTR